MMRTTYPAATVTRSWIRCYTLGLSRQTRQLRQDEIESDLWEHERDVPDGAMSRLAFGLAVFSRLARGMPADLFWRFQMEGPKVEINIPFERIAGGLLLGLVALIMLTGGISGYDTNANGFDGELRRLAALNTFQDNANTAFRLITGVGLLGAAAGFYVVLRERGSVLATIAAFGLVAAGALTLAAAALQGAFVSLAEEYVSSSGAHQEQVLVTARGVALVVHGTVGGAVLTLVLSTYALAVLTARERLVPSRLIALPALSLTAFAAGGIAEAAGADASWIVFISGVGFILLWLIIAGVCLIFNPRQETATIGGMAPVSSV